MRDDSVVDKAVDRRWLAQWRDRLRPETCMENCALQGGPIPVLSTERSPPNLTAALTRLRRSFLGFLSGSSGLMAQNPRLIPRLIVKAQAALARANFTRSNFGGSLPVGFKPKLAGPFQGFEALDAGRQLAGSVESGLSRRPGQIGLARLLCRHAASVRFANGYRNGVPLQA